MFIFGVIFWLVWAGACVAGLYLNLPEQKKQQLKDFIQSL
jgi:hypothetical protein